jgi:DNA-binding NtrC family response regulator
MARILVADDEARMVEILRDILVRDGHEVTAARGGEEALAHISEGAFDLVVSDLKMPGADGMAVLRATRARSPATEVILVTAYATVPGAVEAIQAGAADYLVKPFSVAELRAKVRKIAERVTPAISQGDPFQSIVGGSAALREAIEAARRVAPTDATVLIVGETGTGKELFARAIHAASPRAAGRLVAVNCAALPETLLESELFGHEKGSFTGAVARKAGLVEAADRGSLFLDEVAELAPATQAKLLRFLQERTFSRVGGTETLQVDVRLIAATHRDLAAAVSGGGFREDLFYRLNVFPLHLPPLRERTEDLPILVRQLLARRGRADVLGEELLAHLRGHDWPGNIRELENVLERLTILAGEGVLRADLLPPELSASQRASAAPLSLEDHERGLIEKALRQAGGNKSAAARLLGISRRRLYSMLERLKGSRPG